MSVEPLADRVQRLNDSVERLADEYQREGVKRDERIAAANKASEDSRKVGRIGVLIGVLGLIVALITTGELIAYKHSVAETRVASCEQYNVQQQNAITHEIRGYTIESNNIAPLPRSPDIQHRVDVFLAQEATESVGGHPYRDCTAEGIADYLSRQKLTPTTLPAVTVTSSPIP